jgi:thioredoxin-dependent peroxiredoxin
MKHLNIILSLLMAAIPFSVSLKLSMKSLPFQKIVSAAIVASALSGVNVQPSTAAMTSTPFTTQTMYLAESSLPAIGSPAPDFTLPSNLDGGKKSISLSDLKGQRTVLYFYPGDFTQGCTIEAQNFQRDIEKYKNLNVKIVGVSVDSIDKHLDFGKTYNLEFPLASDVGGQVSNKYGTLLDLGFIGKFSNRQTYIISPDGKIDYVFTDVEGRLAKHSDEVLAKLEELKK